MWLYTFKSQFFSVKKKEIKKGYNFKGGFLQVYRLTNDLPTHLPTQQRATIKKNEPRV
jgi:hypothetical protein